MEINIEKTVAFTGHRQNRITLPEDRVKLLTYLQIEHLINKGYTTFLSGMAEGFDMVAAEMVLEARMKYPLVRLIAVIPWPGQNKYFSPQNKARYQRILARANHRVIISPHYFSGCFHRRNDYLVDHSSVVVCYFDDAPKGGTFYTVERAIGKYKPVLNIAQKEDLAFCALGNSISVCDCEREKSGDYLKIAHINRDRTIEWFGARLSLTAAAEIRRYAARENQGEYGKWVLEPLDTENN